MRLFLAILLSDEMKDALIHTQNRWYDAGVRGNYTAEENLHLTLASEVSFAPFSLCLEGVGCFGDLWWAGMKESAALDAVVRRIRRALSEHDIPFDRKRFRAHITLIRKASGALPAARTEPAAMRVERLSLMRSDRGRNGMIYTEIGTREAEAG